MELMCEFIMLNFCGHMKSKLEAHLSEPVSLTWFPSGCRL